jgi:hypothetical protein
MIEPDESHWPGPWAKAKSPRHHRHGHTSIHTTARKDICTALHKSVEVLLYASRQVNIQFQTKIDALFESRNHILAFEFFDSWRLCRSQFRYARKLHPTTGDHEITKSLHLASARQLKPEDPAFSCADGDLPRPRWSVRTAQTWTFGCASALLFNSFMINERFYHHTR